MSEYLNSVLALFLLLVLLIYSLFFFVSFFSFLLCGDIIEFASCIIFCLAMSPSFGAKQGQVFRIFLWRVFSEGDRINAAK